jgi:hypothetical protein
MGANQSLESLLDKTYQFSVDDEQRSLISLYHASRIPFWSAGCKIILSIAGLKPTEIDDLDFLHYRFFINIKNSAAQNTLEMKLEEMNHRKKNIGILEFHFVY